MYIKEYKILKFSDSFMNYYPIDSNIERPLSYIYLFFHDAYSYIRRFEKTAHYMAALEEIEQDEGEYEYNQTSISPDKKNNLIYIHEPRYDYSRQAATPKLEHFMNYVSSLYLCKNKLIPSIFMTKDNFIHLLLTWEKTWENKSPFALLYLDEKNWYDVLPFDSQEAMEEFIATHTQQEK